MMKKYVEALRNTSIQLEADFEKSISINHAASKGTMREEIISKLIRPFLPNIYGLSSGECFSSDDKMSRQLDLIIYDYLYSYKVPMSDNFIQFPCESVYGNIEVKSLLDKNEFLKSVYNIASLKKLQREDSSSLDITPFRRVNLGAGLTVQNDDIQNKYIGIVFAYDAPNIETVMKYFDEINESYRYMPDFFVIYKKKTIICKFIGGSVPKEIGFSLEDYDGYIAINTEEDTLPIFILELLSSLKYRYLKSADISKLPNEILNNKENCLKGNFNITRFIKK